MLLKKNQSLMAFLALMLLCLIWGYNWVVMKNALHFAGPFDFAALRTLLGALCLFIVMLILKKPFKIQEIPSLIVLGLLQTAGFTGLLVWALVEGGAGKTAVLTYTMPFWTMLLAWPLLGEKLSGWQWPAAFFSLMGILFILDPLHLGTDLFRSYMAYFTTEVNNTPQKRNLYMDERMLRISITYKFGNKKLTNNQRETGNEEIKQRLK